MYWNFCKGGHSIISVIIPLYNKEPHVKRSLSSVLNQTIQDFEIIVVNDGSTDKGLQVVKSFSDSRIRLINQENLGVSIARNRGIGAAKSELIAFLDADDEWMPHYLETILRLRENFPYAGMYITSLKTEFIDNVLMDKDEELRKLIPDEGLLSNYFKVCLKKDASECELFSTSSVTVPKKVFSELGGFQTGFWWGEDIDMWGRIALKYPVAYSSQVCAIYYQNVVNSASHRKRPVETHPFVKTGKEALKLGRVPHEVIPDLEKYIEHVEMYTAKHNIEAGDKNLAFNLLSRNDMRLDYKKILINSIFSIVSENDLSTFSKFKSKK